MTITPGTVQRVRSLSSIAAHQPPILELANARHRAEVVDAAARGAMIGYWFGNFCVIGARPAFPVFLRVNRMKGRPGSQPGSVVTTPQRLGRMFDWSQLPRELDRTAVQAGLDALVALGPIGMRGPATDSIPPHLSAYDGRVRTVQVVLPGAACPSNDLVAELLDRIGGDVIFGTSANMSKALTGRIAPSHNEMRAFHGEFGDRPGMVFIGPADERSARAGLPLHLPGSTSILSFHRHAADSGGAALVLERHGSLAPQVIRHVLARHGLGLVLAKSARERMPMHTVAPHGLVS